MNSQQNPSRHRVGLLVLMAVFSLLCLFFENAAAAPGVDICAAPARVFSDPLLHDNVAFCAALRLL